MAPPLSARRITIKSSLERSSRAFISSGDKLEKHLSVSEHENIDLTSSPTNQQEVWTKALDTGGKKVLLSARSSTGAPTAVLGSSRPEGELCSGSLQKNDLNLKVFNFSHEWMSFFRRYKG